MKMAKKTVSKKTATKKASGAACKKACKGSASSCKSKTAAMKITSRIVNVRRHTTGYVAGGKKYTVNQIRSMASKGRIKGVQVVGNHVQSMPGQKRLTDLPTKVMK
jgi:hypothetical protein